MLVRKNHTWFQELEKKRNEERIRQKEWEQRHRLGSFRRRAKLPVPADEDTTPSAPTTQGEDQSTQAGVGMASLPAQPPINPPQPGQYLRPVYPTTGQLSGRATPGRRLSDVGLATSMLGRYGAHGLFLSLCKAIVLLHYICLQSRDAGVGYSRI